MHGPEAKREREKKQVKERARGRRERKERKKLCGKSRSNESTALSFQTDLSFSLTRASPPFSSFPRPRSFATRQKGNKKECLVRVSISLPLPEAE